jgi:hypothetical protein
MTTTPPQQAGPTPDLKGRILTAVQAEPAPARTAVRQRAWLTLAISALVALGIFLEFGGIRTGSRPSMLVVGTCLGWGVAAGVAAAIGVARGRSMLGRSTATLAVLIVVVPIALLAWKIAVTMPFGPVMMAPWPARPGVRCLGLTLAIAAPLLIALVVLRHRSDPVHPAIAGAALGITAGVASGALVDLWCPIAYVPHVLLGHILPLFLVATFGAWAGRRFLPP